MTGRRPIAYTNRATGTTTRTTRTDEGAAISRNPRGAGNGGFVAAGESGNVYAGRDGNVYKNDGSGWQQAEWRRRTGRRRRRRDQLNQDRAARSSGIAAHQ